MQKRCFLRPVDQTHDPIELLDNTPLKIGRGPITQIKDSRCSRNQVIFLADFANNMVKATQLGRNACALDGVELTKDTCVEMTHKQKFDVLLGQYSYVLEFDPPPGKNVGEFKITINDVSDSDEELPLPPKHSKIALETPPDYKVTNTLWEAVNNDLLIYKSRSEINSKIAAFDLDGTLIVTQSGHTFPKHPNDWKIQFPQVLNKLSKLKAEGFKIVIFTNQGSLNNCPNTAAVVRSFQSKMENVVRKLNVPVEVYVAKGKGLVRKPCVGMWDAMMTRNESTPADKQASFYCGDAAGRVYAGRSDFSQADVLFARNLGLKFYTPEEYFLGIKENYPIKITAFDYSTLSMTEPLCSPKDRIIHSMRQELVILTGCPGSGKSHFVEIHMRPLGYDSVSRDSLGSMDKCLAQADYLLAKGHRVVVDNTNPTVAARKKFADLAFARNIPVRIFIMKTSKSHARHNIRFRELFDSNHDVIGDAVINMFFKSFEEVTLKECNEILWINFWPTLKCPERKAIYKQFLCEK